MFLKTPGTVPIVIRDLYKVHVPIIPPHGQIEGWELKKSDQMWRRKPIPKFYTERREEEKYIQDKEYDLVQEGIMPHIKHFDQALENYRRQEWYRRIMGHWFMSNGTPIYITGAHYYYLQWCQFDHPENEGYPLFYENQVHRFYFRQLCWEDPYSMGYIIIGARGFGKTSEEVACQLENITRPGHRRHAGIQSKTEPDARETIFREKTVPVFNTLPEFFKPVYNHGSDPEKKMVFKRDSKGGKEARKVKYGNDHELGNTIRIFAAKDKAMDGKTQTDIINDEIGKTDPKKEADVYKRTAVNVKVVFRNNFKRGLLRETSTVEEMDKGGDECYEVYKESDPRTRDGNGYTISKLYKYFVSALETQSQLADVYGHIPAELAYEAVMSEREPIKDDAGKLSIVMRKNPITEEEAFIKDQGRCMFNIFIITARIQQLKQLRTQPGRVGKFHWIDDIIDGEVEFIDDNEGKVTIWEFPEKNRGERKIGNACVYTFNDYGKKIWLPCNDDIYTSGCDPIKYVQTDDPRASKMACYGFWKFDPFIDDKDAPTTAWRSHCQMWKYHGRSEDPEDDYEQVIMGMRYYGHSVMPESNITEFNKHLKGRGYQRFRMVRKDFDESVLEKKDGAAAKQTPGSVPEVQTTYIGKLRKWVLRHAMRSNDLPLLQQLRDFESDNTTKYDLVVALGYTLIGIEKRLEEQESQRVIDIMKDLFPRFDVSGLRSKAIPAQVQSDDTSLINEMLGLPFGIY